MRKKRLIPAKKRPAALTLELFKQGKTIPLIAQERRLNVQTIYNHLSGYIASGEIALSELIDTTKGIAICNAIRMQGIASLKTLKKLLDDEYAWIEVRAVIEAGEPGNHT